MVDFSVRIGKVPTMTLRQRLSRILFLGTCGLLLGIAVAGMSIVIEKAYQSPAGRIAASNIGGPYLLTDQDGKPRTEKDFSRSYKLIYFGFTYCPVICPTELQKMTTALRTLPTETQQKIQPLFISVDPERDTPALLKSYVALFDPRLIGLTGTEEQIDSIKKTYKVYATKAAAESGGPDDYSVDHSSFIYLMSPDDRLLALFKTADTADVIAASINEVIRESRP